MYPSWHTVGIGDALINQTPPFLVILPLHVTPLASILGALLEVNLSGARDVRIIR